MRIITETRLSKFWPAHPDAETPLKVWRKIVRAKQYGTPHEVKQDFPAADFPGRGVTVFDLGGNTYRLVVSMRYDLGRVYIRQVVTHEEYDRPGKRNELQGSPAPMHD